MHLALDRYDTLHAFVDAYTTRREAFAARRALEQATVTLAATEPLAFHCSVHGGLSPFGGESDAAPDWREGLVCTTCRLNGRMRFSLALMRELAPRGRESHVYLTEHATFGFVAARAMFASTQGSEFMPDPRRRAQLTAYLQQIAGDSALRIRHEDATALRFHDAAFDAIGSFDVLEHIPDYAAALREFARVLRPGGVLVLTAPFLPANATTLVRARIDRGGEVEHLLPPEYHGDPVAADGVLCFYHFGWDLLDAMRAAGFARAEVVGCWSPTLGFYDGISAFVATR